jgi:F-type H+-transporting ATPase subunit epsilon
MSMSMSMPVPEPGMQLRILLPSRVYAEKSAVLRIVAETSAGSFGLLPQRLDCVAALVPGILTYETEGDGEVFVAVDQGTLVKTGPQVVISVRRALGGNELARLRRTVEREFLRIDEEERGVRLVLARLESGFLRRLAAFQRE